LLLCRLRNLSLDPNLIAAASYLARSQAERGELIKGEELVRRRPDSPEGHAALNYVLRYAGLLKESERECEVVVLMDPANTRSCAIAFFLSGDYKRAMEFLQVDPTTDFNKAILLATFLRAGKQKEALQIGLPRIPQWVSFDMLPECAQHKPAAEIATLAADVRANDDPEANYLAAANLQAKNALRLLRLAVQGNYCSWPAMDSDPLLASVRTMPEFAAIRAAGIACQQNFLAARQRVMQQAHR
jgi:hypothetical protein